MPGRGAPPGKPLSGVFNGHRIASRKTQRKAPVPFSLSPSSRSSLPLARARHNRAHNQENESARTRARTLTRVRELSPSLPQPARPPQAPKDPGSPPYCRRVVLTVTPICHRFPADPTWETRGIFGKWFDPKSAQIGVYVIISLSTLRFLSLSASSLSLFPLLLAYLFLNLRLVSLCCISRGFIVIFYDYEFNSIFKTPFISPLSQSSSPININIFFFTFPPLSFLVPFPPLLFPPLPSCLFLSCLSPFSLYHPLFSLVSSLFFLSAFLPLFSYSNHSSPLHFTFFSLQLFFSRLLYFHFPSSLPT